MVITRGDVFLLQKCLGGRMYQSNNHTNEPKGSQQTSFFYCCGSSLDAFVLWLEGFAYMTDRMDSG